MLENYLDFRKMHCHDLIMTIPIQNFDLIYQNYACGYCHYDYHGNLLAIEEPAKSKPEKIMKDFSEEQVIHFLIQKYERMINLVMPYLSKLHNRRVDQTFLIVDLKNVKPSLFLNKKVREFLTICSKMGQDYYPEILFKCFIINAPFIFKSAWSFISKLLDEKTVNKFHVESGNGVEELRKFMNIDFLPVSMGGKNAELLNESNGPWKNELQTSYQKCTFFLEDRSPHYQFFLSEEEKLTLTPKSSASTTLTIDENESHSKEEPEKNGQSFHLVKTPDSSIKIRKVRDGFPIMKMKKTYFFGSPELSQL